MGASEERTEIGENEMGESDLGENLNGVPNGYISEGNDEGKGLNADANEDSNDSDCSEGGINDFTPPEERVPLTVDAHSGERSLR